MDLNLVERNGKSYLEGPAGQTLLRHVDDAVLLVEACANYQTDCLMLFAENLTENFFDLSSREAGEILQKLRNYYVRLAVILTPGTRQLSSRFSELMVEENRNRYFHLFEERSKAETWLLEA